MHAAATPTGISATQAAALLGTPVPTAYHLLNTLVDEGLLAKDAGRRYVMGIKAGVIADGWMRLDRTPDAFMRALHGLAERTAETAYVTAWHGATIRVLASVEGRGAVRVAEVPRGPYRCPHARASGKVLLAHADDRRRSAALAAPLERLTPSTLGDRAALDAELDRVRDRGWAQDREEFVVGVSCLAAPVVVEGVVIAALSISVPTARFDREREPLCAALLDTAREASASASPTSAEEAA